MDLFQKLTKGASTPLAELSHAAHGIAAYPRLTGPIGRRMAWQGKEMLVWSINNYLGLADHPEVRAADAEFADRYGLATPMGARMMSGETDELEALESELAAYARKPAALFFNFGYQGMFSLIDALVDRHDWIVYDGESHACIIDGVRLHRGPKKAFPHNDIGRLESILARIERERHPDDAVLVISEGVFGMSGAQGRLRDIVALKERYDFRLLVDDAHGFGVLGPDGGGTGEEQGVQDGIDLYFGTFAKAGASIGAFVAGDADVLWRLRYTMRSQIFAKGLPWPIVAGNRVRLRLMRTRPELRQKCFAVSDALKKALIAADLNIGPSAAPVTPVFFDSSGLDLIKGVEYLRVLREKYGVFCSGVIYPVVPAGVAQLRLIPTAAHEVEDVEPTVQALLGAAEEVIGRTFEPASVTS
ncbi:aminotransferase class I/II-fold pyridoxal phosphate-dependent enzyme [Actinoallomurus spadix]|uniref:8-amino-7-oxononanoate synthase n=1 Tax=Actinoallomurus spadix TaxID=79912 RepID=A0ABN0W1E8_9ACTN|nr:aminotransferase class I/II-fold pyridoxal phosphate-dependent enzyme [Actinoallomurus spadix]MCO5985374.1 aminotransferase class I/II-fold pyridoxal phosphate-dependent enzyme [Actinoallomurus spadix]